MIRQIKSSVAFAGLIFCLPSPVSARTWNVFADGSGDAPTIQAGIDSAATGDTVFAQPGRFVENIDFVGKAVVVRGSGSGISVLDGSSQPESCARFRTNETRASVLEGFTITGGTGSCTVVGNCNYGGGIYALNAEPTIRENLITGNQVTDWGGGIYCASSRPTSPLIESNTIEGNRAQRNAGGIAAGSGAVPIILNNIIQDNEATDGDGGGIWIWTNTDGAVVTQNEIVGNLAGDHGGGICAALNTTGVPVSMEFGYNLIVGNTARGTARVYSSGGGIWMGDVAAWTHHNTFARNEGQGPDSTWGGGGIAANNCGSSLIEQNIIALSTYGAGIRCTGSGSPTIRNNLGWQNAGGHGSGLCATWWQSNGNVIDDPHFCDMANGDFHVASNSGVMTHPAGPLGAFFTPGCGPVSILPSTWGSLKAKYSSGH
jgi:parallel beta-helix repeat protein